MLSRGTVRLLLSSTLLGSIAAAGCATAPLPPGCDGSRTVQLGESSSPICEIETSINASGGVSLGLDATVGPNAEYGTGRDLGDLNLFVSHLGSRWQVSTANLNLGPPHTGISLTNEWTYQGTCDVVADASALTIDCGFASEKRSFHLRGTLPPAPDPRADPSIVWLDVHYAFAGDYAAAAVVEAAVSVNRTSIFGVTLADGGLVMVFPAGNDVGQFAALSLRDANGEMWRSDSETPSLGTCATDLAEAAWTGTLSCAGDPDSPSGSSSLELSWKPAD